MNFKQRKILFKEEHSAFCVENEWEEGSQGDWLEGSRNILKGEKKRLHGEMLVEISYGLSHFWDRIQKT